MENTTTIKVSEFIYPDFINKDKKIHIFVNIDAVNTEMPPATQIKVANLIAEIKLAIQPVTVTKDV